MTDTTELPLTATEQLELRAIVARLEAELSRFGDRWTRRQPRSKGPPPDPMARLALLQVRVAGILLDR